MWRWQGLEKRSNWLHLNPNWPIQPTHILYTDTPGSNVIVNMSQHNRQCALPRAIALEEDGIGSTIHTQQLSLKDYSNLGTSGDLKYSDV